jgi:hypothetical protein
MHDKVNNERKQINNDAHNKAQPPPGDPVCASGNPRCPSNPAQPATVVTSGNDLTSETTAWSNQQYKNALNTVGSVIHDVSTTGSYNWFNSIQICDSITGCGEEDGPEVPLVFRTAYSRLIHAASCFSRYSSWTCCGVR